MAIVPYEVDVPMSRWPYANWVIIGVTSLAFLLAFAGDVRLLELEPLILYRGNPSGIIGHMLLHGGWLHIVGNMVFLWTFGNAVCAKVTNIAYPVIYLGLGAMSAIIHLIIDGDPAVGASGAINGIIGMYLVFYPQNEVTCLWWIIFRAGTFAVSSIWMILFWLAFDIWGAWSGAGGVAYWAHLGGFFSGFALASSMLWLGWVEMTETETSIYDLMSR
ncbi:MAG: rhomboid family intramembrane serine protease [Candidatus Hydrogenedentes bacterium]|nr:rhomboid family intramembrane serine protease [Candidatus Hydrogenedentota bacterium]